jgi:hypothetical protein
VTKLGFGVVPAWGYFLPFCLNLSRFPAAPQNRRAVTGCRLQLLWLWAFVGFGVGFHNLKEGRIKNHLSQKG